MHIAEGQVGVFHPCHQCFPISFHLGLPTSNQRSIGTHSSTRRMPEEETDELWGEIAKGKGSDPARKKLLATFLKMGGDLKGKKDVWHKELLQYSKKVGHLAATGKAL